MDPSTGTSDHPKSSKLRRRLGRFVLVLIFAAMLVLLLIAGLWLLVAPTQIERRLAAELQKMGLPGSSVHLGRVTTHDATLFDIAIGSEARLHIEHLRATFSPESLQNYRLDTLHLAGLVLRITLNPDGSVDLGDLAKFKLPPDDPADPDSSADWPLNRIILEQSTLIVQTATTVYHLPLSGEVDLQPGRKVKIDLTCTLPDRTAHLLASTVMTTAADQPLTASARLAISPGDITIPGQAIIAQGASADLHFTLRTQPLRVIVEPGSRLAVRHLEGDLGGWSLADPSQGDQITFAITQPATFSLDTPAPNGWQFTAPAVDALLAASDLTGPSAAAVAGLALHLPISLTATPGSATIHLNQPAQLRLASLRIGDIHAAPQQNPLVLAIQSEEPIVTWQPASVAINGSVAMNQPWTVNSAGAVVSMEQTAAQVGIHLPLNRPDGRPTVNARVDATASNIAVGGMTIPGATVSLPVRMNVPQPESAAEAAEAAGRVQIAAIKTGQVTLGPTAGQVAMIDGVLTAGVATPIAGDITARTAVTWSGSSGTITTVIDPTIVSDVNLFSRLIPQLAGIGIDGVFGGSAKLVIEEGRLVDQRAVLKLDAVGVQSGELGVSVENIAGQVELTSLWPLATPMMQRLTAARMDMGELTFSDLDVLWQMSGRQLLVEAFRWRLGETGRFAMYAVPIDLDKPVFDAELHVERLNLADWVSVLTGEQVSATGELYGRIPLRFDPRGEKLLTFRPGFIYAAPGRGVLTFENAQSVLEVLSATTELDAVPRDIRDRTVQALTDFEYAMFKFEFIPEDGGTMLRIQTSGQGRQDNPIPIGRLTINVRGFEDAVNGYLRFDAWLDRMKNRGLNPPEPSSP